MMLGGLGFGPMTWVADSESTAAAGTGRTPDWFGLVSVQRSLNQEAQNEEDQADEKQSCDPLQIGILIGSDHFRAFHAHGYEH